MQHPLSLMLALLLLGCATLAPQPEPKPTATQTGGRVMGDATQIYWLTEHQNNPIQGAEQVWLGDYGGYQSQYHWQSGALIELWREGQQLKGAELVAYQLSLRFDPQGNLVHQQSQVDGLIAPLSLAQVADHRQQAQRLVATSREQANQGLGLFQGIWDGQALSTCAGQRYVPLLPSSMPDYLRERLQGRHFVALLGSAEGSNLQVQEVLIIAEPSRACVRPPNLATPSPSN